MEILDCWPWRITGSVELVFVASVVLGQAGCYQPAGLSRLVPRPKVRKHYRTLSCLRNWSGYEDKVCVWECVSVISVIFAFYVSAVSLC